MAIIVTTNQPNKLLTEVKTAIDSGTVETWKYDKDGDFIHSAPQWSGKAWLRPNVEESKITFRIFPPVNTTMSKTVYAVYHADFLKMLLTHFDTSFSRALVTSLPAHGDRVKA